MLSLLLSHKLSFMFPNAWNYVDGLRASVHIFGLVRARLKLRFVFEH